MPKTPKDKISYKVWIEIEKWNDGTEEGVTVDGALGFACTAEFKSERKAIAFAERLNQIGEELQ